MAKTRIEELWDGDLQHVMDYPLLKDGLRLTRIDPVLPCDIYAGIDDTGRRVLAIGVRTRPPALTLESSTLECFRQQRANRTWLLALRLSDAGLRVVFGRLCQDLVEAARLMETEAELLELFVARLRLWQMLFIGGSDGTLPSHQVRGLIAELLVLERLVQLDGKDAIAAISAWVGPHGSDQDFVFPASAIEVKALSVGRSSVAISSLKQLDCQVPLTLAIITLEPAAMDSDGALNLNSLVARVEGQIASNSKALRSFRDRVLEAGYVCHDRYDEECFIPVQSRFFDVTADFPKLTSATVNAAIRCATYEINIANLTAFKRESLRDE